MLKAPAVAATLLALAGAACVVDPTFTEPQVSGARPVTVSGYLKFGFENRNLFPGSNWQDHYRRGECLPVAVPSSDAALTSRVRQLDARRVRITGTIERLLRPGEINPSFCKPTGLRVHTIEPQ